MSRRTRLAPIRPRPIIPSCTRSPLVVGLVRCRSGPTDPGSFSPGRAITTVGVGRVLVIAVPHSGPVTWMPLGGHPTCWGPVRWCAGSMQWPAHRRTTSRSAEHRHTAWVDEQTRDDERSAVENRTTENGENTADDQGYGNESGNEVHGVGASAIFCRTNPGRHRCGMVNTFTQLEAAVVSAFSRFSSYFLARSSRAVR